MAGATSEIVLALGAAVLPLRHPLLLFNFAANGRSPSDVIAQIGTHVLPKLERAG